MLIWGFPLFFVLSYVTGAGSGSFLEPLSAEEEKKYLEEYKNGSEEARNILIERNMRLVAHIVKKYPNYCKDSEDLISIGTIGLIKAIMTYKDGKGTRLATYAARCIENEILMTLRSVKKYSNDVYLQDTVGIDKDGNEVTLQDKVADDSASVDEQVGLIMQTKVLYEKMRKVLKGRERKVIELRYGLATGEEVTQREIAKLLGISRSYVSRIEKKALSKMKKEMEE